MDCAEYNETVSFDTDGYPALDDMLCSLVLQGNVAQAEGPKAGVMGQEISASAGELHMHAHAYVWLPLCCLLAMMAA